MTGVVAVVCVCTHAPGGYGRDRSVGRPGECGRGGTETGEGGEKTEKLIVRGWRGVYKNTFVRSVDRYIYIYIRTRTYARDTCRATVRTRRIIIIIITIIIINAVLSRTARHVAPP